MVLKLNELRSCLSSWDFSIDPCDNIFTDHFTCGLRCDTLVFGLFRVPDSFSNLTRLGRLGLSENSVTGEIPAVLGSLPHLQELYLDNNHLHEPIRSSFNNLTRLKRLKIQRNYISGEFPDMGSLKKVYFLDANDNNVSDQVPSTLPVPLVKLSMRNNIPDNIDNIRQQDSYVNEFPSCFTRENEGSGTTRTAVAQSKLEFTYNIRATEKLQGSHVALILEGKDLVHLSKQGQALRSTHMEILQSPWLCELMVFHVNLRVAKAKSGTTPALFEGCYLTFNDGKTFLSCEPFDSVKLDIDLTCSICLDTVLDSASLACGHIFCYMCVCSTASVTIVNCLKAAEPKEKCPLCREAGVHGGFVHLDELSLLLKRSYREYREQWLQKERTERVRRVKECRAFIGV
ncbi:putative E3 ubiquitin-protein ligase BAH1-like 1 [Hibiscus syriacus]|uniref:E3 ubiquitin-protein ligase BAH1-like 1 n=1 Tax=Hibiscus syriacus TaxID=106335 RepID=A0A6A2Y1H6_HIBSY|nr:putative E3 ubiquitin-protein ligase BAH1-like 1 [Hibiscus syriacus]